MTNVMLKIIIIVIYLFLTGTEIILSYAEKITYVSIERPKVHGFNRNYLSNVTMVSHRFGRHSPVYYVDLNYTSVFVMNNTLKVDFYFYEFLSNVYKPSFVEMHFRWCKLIHNDLFFGAAMKQGKLGAPCPYPPGDYVLMNMTILPDAIPSGFPFTKGRIYANLTFKDDFVADGHVDMEIKTIKVKERKKYSKL